VQNRAWWRLRVKPLWKSGGEVAKEKVIDTTAAGDSFSAGYLAVRLTAYARSGGTARTPDRQHGDSVSRGDYSA
jgi:sugar/nucleoside kinase (ribokinase family)